MKNLLLIVGIFILIVALSFSGCLEISDNEGSSNNGDHTNDNMISFYDLDNELYKYADKEISIEGNIHWTLGKSWDKSTYVGKFRNLEDWHDDFGTYRIDLIIPNNVNLLHNTDYIITGIAREPEIYGDNPIIEVISAKMNNPISDYEGFWVCEYGLSFVEDYIYNQSQYADWCELGMGPVHHGVFNATINIYFHTEDNISYQNKYTVAMELNESSDITKKDSWNLISIDEEIDIWDNIPDL